MSQSAENLNFQTLNYYLNLKYTCEHSLYVSAIKNNGLCLVDTKLFFMFENNDFWSSKCLCEI